MGVLPLVFKDGQRIDSLGLDGSETFHINGIEDIKPRKVLQVKAINGSGRETDFEVIARLDTGVEVGYFENGGILPFVLRRILNEMSD
jgi:aconitate hydratase